MTDPKAGALVMVDIPNTFLDDETAAYIQKYGIRSVCLFSKNVKSEEQLRRLCSGLRELIGENALIAIDHEGGAIVRPDFWPFVPSAMALGAANNTQLSLDMSAILAKQLISVGINWNFSPVLDVNINSGNPVIGERAYGSEPELVLAHGLAAISGHERHRVASCIKHFPGHGDTHLDSHYNLPSVTKSISELEACELKPFYELIHKAPALMTAHILYPALDDIYPATLSKKILSDLLRTEWGYEGVIITDSMGMKAVASNYGRGEAGVMALRAGADLVMALGSREAQLQTIEAIEQALPSIDADSKIRRLSALSANYPAKITAEYTKADIKADTESVTAAWAAALTSYKNPVAPKLGSTVVLLAHEQPVRENVSEAAITASALADELAKVYKVKLIPFNKPEEIDWELAKSLGFPVILASTFRHRQEGFVGKKPDLHLALYNPYIALDIEAPALITYGCRPEAVAAAINWMRGDLATTGQMPFAQQA